MVSTTSPLELLIFLNEINDLAVLDILVPFCYNSSMLNEKGTKMSKSVNVSLTPEQVDFLRGVMYEYFHQNYAYTDAETEALRAEVEDVLAAAENEIYLAD